MIVGLIYAKTSVEVETLIMLIAKITFLALRDQNLDLETQLPCLWHNFYSEIVDGSSSLFLLSCCEAKICFSFPCSFYTSFSLNWKEEFMPLKESLLLNVDIILGTDWLVFGQGVYSFLYQIWTEIKFLGHTISQDGVSVDPEKVQELAAVSLKYIFTQADLNMRQRRWLDYISVEDKGVQVIKDMIKQKAEKYNVILYAEIYVDQIVRGAPFTEAFTYPVKGFLLKLNWENKEVEHKGKMQILSKGLSENGVRKNVSLIIARKMVKNLENTSIFFTGKIYHTLDYRKIFGNY
ncbi:hypothetical protein ACJX0J_024783 [Zea mays]